MPWRSNSALIHGPFPQIPLAAAAPPCSWALHPERAGALVFQTASLPRRKCGGHVRSRHCGVSRLLLRSNSCDVVGDQVEALEPVVRLPDAANPFSVFWSFGWSWNPELSLDENLLRFAFAGRLNCFRMRGYHSGHCGAMFCRRPQRLPPAFGVECSRLEIEVLGLGVNAPPRFAVAAARRRRSASPRTSAQAQRRHLGVLWSAVGATLSAAVGALLQGWRRDVAAHAHKSKGGGRRGMKNLTKQEIHSEMQIIARCARAGVPVRGAWAYVAKPPCWNCCKALLAAGVERVVFQDYKPVEMDVKEAPGLRQRLAAEAAGVEWVMLEPCKEREKYVDALWSSWKQREGLDRAAIKAMSTHEPL